MIGAGTVVFGVFCRENVRDEERKSIASIVSVLGLAILAGGVYQAYSEYLAEIEEQEFQRAFESIPTEGKLGELFAIFREKIVITRENYLSKGASVSPVMWGCDSEKGHELVLQANYQFTENSVYPVVIKLFQDPENPKAVISQVNAGRGYSFMGEWASKLVPKVVSAFDRFLSGEKVYEATWSDSWLQLT